MIQTSDWEQMCKYVYIFWAKGIESRNDKENSFGWLSEENMFSWKW